MCDRSVDVAAPPDLVFAWVCQLRAAPYSYDLIDNFGRRSPRQRDPRLTDLAKGQRFMGLFELVDFTPQEQVTLRARGCVVTYAVRDDQAGSRLHARAIFRGHPYLIAPMVAGDFVMMRKQLLTLKQLAERESTTEKSI